MGPDLWFTKVNSLEDGYKEVESKGTDDSNISGMMPWLGQSAGESGPQRARDQVWGQEEEGLVMNRFSSGDFSQTPQVGPLVGTACRSRVQV